MIDRVNSTEVGPEITCAGAGQSPELYYLRNPETAITVHRAAILIVRKDSRTSSIRSNVQLIALLARELRQPRRLEELASATGVRSADLLPMMEFLVHHQVVCCGSHEELQRLLTRPPTRISERAAKRRLVVGLSGAVHSAVALPWLLTLKQHFASKIDLVLTESARHFVTSEALTSFGFTVWTDVFGDTRSCSVPHIALADQTDMVLIFPASAHTIHRLATGECSDLLSLTVAATSAPVVVAPAMNPQMLAFLPIQQNIERLRQAGLYVLEPSLAIEVSTLDETGDLSFSGVGLDQMKQISMLEAILSSHEQEGIAVSAG